MHDPTAPTLSSRTGRGKCGDRVAPAADDRVAGGWFAAGATLGVALDAAKGEMLAFLAPIADSATAAAAYGTSPIWKSVYANGVQPGAAVGGGLFPCLSGGDGAKVRVNAGLDAARPLRLPPPTREFRPAGQAWAARAAAEVRCAAPPLARA